MQQIIFYLPKDSMNDATEYYVNLLKKGFEDNGYSIKIVDNITDLGENQNIFTVRGLDQNKIKNKFKNLFNWFQGIGPEEYLLLHNNSLKSKIISKYLSYIEKKALKRSSLCFFVSEAMKAHYEKKYKLNLSDKSIIIPCYNIPLENKNFESKKRYDELNFVYAGGIFAWQCIDETLLIFKEIHKLDSSAKLTLLTGDKSKALDLIQKYNVPNVNIDYVKLDQLQDKLSEFKYGFLIRKKDVINYVSTPTKMNSYLAAGLIPIYTDVIDSFEKNINIENTLKFKHNDTPEHIASEIVKFHKKNIDSKELYNSYQRIFDEYYNDAMYRQKITEFFNINGTF